MTTTVFEAFMTAVNPDYRQDEMVYQMDHSEADLVVCLATRVADLQAVARERSRPLPIVDAARLPARLPRPETSPRGGRRDSTRSAASSTRRGRRADRRDASSPTTTT